MGEKVNTKVEYMYRDAANYKQHGQAVFPGLLSEEEVATVWANTDDYDCHFFPGQVGLPTLYDNFERAYDDLDHPWHELVLIEATDEPPTTPLTAEFWAEQWVGIVWNESSATDDLNAWVEEYSQDDEDDED